MSRFNSGGRFLREETPPFNQRLSPTSYPRNISDDFERNMAGPAYRNLYRDMRSNTNNRYGDPVLLDDRNREAFGSVGGIEPEFDRSRFSRDLSPSHSNRGDPWGRFEDDNRRFPPNGVSSRTENNIRAPAHDLRFQEDRFTPPLPTNGNVSNARYFRPNEPDYLPFSEKTVYNQRNEERPIDPQRFDDKRYGEQFGSSSNYHEDHSNPTYNRERNREEFNTQGIGRFFDDEVRDRFPFDKVSRSNNPEIPFDSERSRERFPSPGPPREVSRHRFNSGRYFDDVPRDKYLSPGPPFGESTRSDFNSARYEAEIPREQFPPQRRENSDNSRPRPPMNWMELAEVSGPRYRDSQAMPQRYEEFSRARDGVPEYGNRKRKLRSPSPVFKEPRVERSTPPRVQNYRRYRSEFETVHGRSIDTPSTSRDPVPVVEQPQSQQNRIVIARDERASAFERLGPLTSVEPPDESKSDFESIRIKKVDESPITKEESAIINNEIEDMILQDSSAYFNLLRFDRTFLTKKNTFYICVCENKITAEWLLDKTLPLLNGVKLIIEKDDVFLGRATLFTDINHCFKSPKEIIDLLKKNNDLSKIDINDWKVTAFRNSSRNTHIAFSIKQKDSMYIKSFLQSRLKVLDHMRPMSWKTQLLRKNAVANRSSRSSRRRRNRSMTKSDFVNL